MDNLIIIDWFAMSYRRKGITPGDIISSLKFKEPPEFKKLPGRYMYRDRVSFGNIHIYYNNVNSEQDFPMLEMSGQGCREFETFSELSFDDLFNLAKDTENYHVTRLDVAYDDHQGILDLPLIEKDYRERNWVSNAVRGRITVDISREKNDDGIYIDGISVMTGVKSSDMYMRIYDKSVERGIKDGRHWVRCELVLKQDRAVQFLKNTEPIGMKFRGVIHNYFRFLTPRKNDSNRRRWEMRPYWKKFLENAGKISVYTPKDIDYNLCRLNRYVFKQAGNSIDTYIRCVGVFKFFDDLIKRESHLNAKQKYLIEQCKLLYEQGEEVTEQVITMLSENYKT